MKQMYRTTLYLFLVHITALLFFSFFRLLLYFSQENGAVAELPNRIWLTVRAFLMGVRFDNVMSCYVMLLPLLVLGFSCCFSFDRKWLSGIVHYFFCFVFSILFVVEACDIPYFGQFFKHLNSSIWNWMDEPSFVVKMIVKEPRFVVYVLLFFVVDAFFCWVLWTIKKNVLCRKTDEVPPTGRESILMAFFVFLLVVCCFLGIRGRLAQKSPIRIGTAYFCNDPFLNQLGLNPSFVFLRTTIDMRKESNQRISLMEDDLAIKNVRRYMNIEDAPFVGDSPIARENPIKGSGNGMNVVLIMMESMASHYVDRKELTPFLNELIGKSVYFPNTNSTGIHTMNGVYGTLFAYPAYPFKTREIMQYESMPVVLKRNGYHTLYFTTHDEQFDNIGGYLSANQVERVISEKDYPSSEVRSNLGVCDDYMFRYSMAILDRVSSSDGKPFFAAFLTASNHQPYIIPKYFTPKTDDEAAQVIEYSDYALRKFFEMSKTKKWFRNTIFVLLGDHGAANNDYDISLAYHHIPLLIYQPQKENDNECICNLSSQMDVFPTVMGLLDIHFINNTFGIDLMKEKRKMLFFSSDNAYCCIDGNNYFVHRDGGTESLYHYKDVDQRDFIKDETLLSDSLRSYVQAMMQTSQFMIKNKLVLLKKDK